MAKRCEYCGYDIHGDAVPVFETTFKNGNGCILDSQPPRPNEFPKSDKPKTRVIWYHKKCSEV